MSRSKDMERQSSGKYARELAMFKKYASYNVLFVVVYIFEKGAE